jgi:deferrochelatase/peroxidase EfeB
MGERPMTHAFVTVAIPFPEANADLVEHELTKLGNPADRKEVRPLFEDRGIHFMSMNVVRGEAKHGAFLILEASADGTVDGALDTISGQLGPKLIPILKAASHDVGEGAVKEFLRRHSHSIGLGLLSTPGLCFSGTPGLTVDRIKREEKLARYVRDLLAKGSFRGTPLEILKAIRAEVARDQAFRELLIPEPAGLLAPAPVALGVIGLLAKLGLKGLWTFTWPVLLPAAAIIAYVVYAAYRTGGALFAAGMFALAFIILVGVLVAIAFLLYSQLRAKEATDEPDDSTPDRAILADCMVRENDGNQNHLFGVSVMKPGLLRNLTLRLVYWVIGQLALVQFRPGFLGDIGTIHFARWILLPGTNKLLFLSNFGGSWESYLEDFITKASNGLTGIWSNTYGYPRTKNVFFEGASDGERFKRWARRQQRPTLFWYSAYPNNTSERIRTAAAVRQGLASASTEDEAADWLSQLGSRVRAADTIQSPQIQSLMFGGMGDLADATCLFLRLPADMRAARAWLAVLAPQISFGDQLPVEYARILALTRSGLERLGLPEERVAEFPIAFQQGMSDPHRAKNVLKDTSEDGPDHWWWGSGDKSPDMALIVYAEPTAGRSKLNAEVDRQIRRLEQHGGSEIHRVVLSTLTKGPAIEAFGFVDGVSQPIIRGTRRWLKQGDSIHVVEPGEIILGYPDNRGHFPPSPTVPATDDPANVLPVVCSARATGELPSFARTSANLPHDLGANGTFFVIRQLEQDVDLFNGFVTRAAATIADHPGVPSGLTPSQREQWVAAKLVGRWKDGTSLVRYPDRPGNGWVIDGQLDVVMSGQTVEVDKANRAPPRHRNPDNDFLLGKEDPAGHLCPFGAHIRRANPRESLNPGSQNQLAITNRHRILRAGRQYGPQNPDDATSRPGLLFMCLNADIERQFEFIQQTWVMERLFHGLDGEVDSILGRGLRGGRLTIPTPAGPVTVAGVEDFVTVRGGGYFFMPGRAAIRYLAQ